jgi:hypothetical protein
MEISTLIATLLAVSSWNTQCIQTGVQNASYNRVEQYSVDQIQFVKSDDVLNATFTREWHHAKDCKDEAFDIEKTETVASVATTEKQSEGSFQPMKPMKPFQNASLDTSFNADFKNLQTGTTELGMISLSSDLKTLRVARGFGVTRNTMLSIIGYTAGE